jgi:hypothetical protein
VIKSGVTGERINITIANRKTNYSDLRTVSLNKTNCSYLINRTHLIILSVVLRQQRGYYELIYLRHGVVNDQIHTPF